MIPFYFCPKLFFMYDAIIIGSGFGGTMTARQLVRAGKKVLMIERGDWVVRRPENWDLRGSVDLTEHYDKTSPLRVEKGGHKKVMGLYASVGGPSVFYGGVSFRFRAGDFEKNPAIAGDSGAEWPITYDDLEPFYSEAEQILRISGEAGTDPTEPPRSAPYPQGAPPLAGISEKVKSAAESLGLHPFQLPLAINYSDTSRPTCQHCTTCDTFACAISAKNDLATLVIPALIGQGMDLKTNMVVTQLNAKNGHIERVTAQDKKTGDTHVFRGRQVVLSAGALGSPHILLSSGLDEHNPGGATIGRYLMRHVNTIIFGIFPGAADKEGRFHKQLAILDYYWGHPDIKGPAGKLGSLQQMPTPPPGLVQNEVPGILGKWLSQGVRLLTGLLAIAEDQPQFGNFIRIDPHQKDRFGMPQPVIRHTYSARDKAAVGALVRPAKKILSRAGAVAHYVHPIRTFSHAVGTVRMGNDPKTSALDAFCRFRGIENLFVVDGSFMPTSAALNPSLTISANALRVGEHIARL
ncbi:MAG: GMC family oxidoreductase [Bacteroidetes bacterium]|nr:MAG: GMC family oxidoreductase [Bacteroidota bacterium]